VVGISRDVEKAKEQFRPLKIEVANNYSAALINELGIDHVIHLSGIAHDLSNKYRPDDYYEVNYEGTKEAYDEFLKSNATKFLFVSSIKAAADISTEPATEDISPIPATDYGKSKLKAEQYIQSRSIRPGKYYYILRPCMIHGPGNKGNLNLFYRFVKSGIPFPFGAFDNQRSFLSINNFIFVVQHLLQHESTSGIYHLADDEFLSTKELYEVIATSLRKRPMILNIPKSWIQTFASIFGKKHLVNKLTEDMMVSNKKIVNEMGVHLPVALRAGISETIQSFEK
jgi:nucleoside-diphosphate-sugar epimerase